MMTRACRLMLLGALAACGRVPVPDPPSPDAGDAAQSSPAALRMAPLGTLPIGITVQLQATVTMSDGTPQDVSADVTWTASDPTVAQVREGILQTIGQGHATVRATYGWLHDSAELEVLGAMPTLSIEPCPIQLAAGGTKNLTALTRYSDGTHEVSAVVAWHTNRPEVALVDSNGLLTCMDPGSATISANLGSLVASCVALCTASEPQAPKLRSLKIMPLSPTLPVHGQLQLRVLGEYSDGSTADITDDVEWGSSNVSIVRVDGGLATGISPGTAEIFAIASIGTASTVVTVLP